jgi:hypothetical protein
MRSLTASISGRAAAVLLFVASASASGTGVLTGVVYRVFAGDPVIGPYTPEPVFGATVGVLGSGTHGSTDRNGRFVLDSDPGPSVVVASAESLFDVIESVQVAAGCTTRADFRLMGPLGTRPDRFALESSETLFVHGRLSDPKLRVDTVIWFADTEDAAARTRSNSARLALVECSATGTTKVACTKASADRLMWLVTGLGNPCPGMSYLREEVSCKTGRFTRDTLSGYCRVISIRVGYIGTTSLRGMEFIEYGTPYPKDKWLVLKLELLGGGTAFF